MGRPRYNGRMRCTKKSTRKQIVLLVAILAMPVATSAGTPLVLRYIPTRFTLTAWFMLGRLREACSNRGSDKGDKLAGIIEVDECFVGGKEANKHESKKLHAGRGSVGKTAVVGLRERGGRVIAHPAEPSGAGSSRAAQRSARLLQRAAGVDWRCGVNRLGRDLREVHAALRELIARCRLLQPGAWYVVWVPPNRTFRCLPFGSGAELRGRISVEWGGDRLGWLFKPERPAMLADVVIASGVSDVFAQLPQFAIDDAARRS
jgi:hypothetical protein